jgi:hypothetical protein
MPEGCTPARLSKTIDGYDRQRLDDCLAARGLVVHAPVVSVSENGRRVGFEDGGAVWVLPRWIAPARLGHA